MTVSHRSTPRSSASCFSPIALACIALAALAGCSTVSEIASGDKVDYRSSSARPQNLEVPPDLSQLTRDSRYAQQNGSISAATFQGGPIAGGQTAATTVAPAAVGDVHIEREGTQRWIATPQTPDQLWPQLEAFWQERGLALQVNDRAAGLMETEWAEDRSKLPNDVIRNTLGKVFDSLYSSGERDRFRTTVERSPSGGSEITITHRGMSEVYTNQLKESTVWERRPADPQLESAMLQRLLVKLGATAEQAKTAVAAPAVAAAASAPAHARMADAATGTSLQVDDPFDRAWRRVGLALDRSGFTVEDRDRAQGIYFVRYVDPSKVGNEDSGTLSKLLFWRDKPAEGLERYRVSVKGDGQKSTVTVLNNQGGADSGASAKRIASLLLDDLK